MKAQCAVGGLCHSLNGNLRWADSVKLEQGGHYPGNQSKVRESEKGFEK